MAPSTQTLTYYPVPRLIGFGWRLLLLLMSWVIGVALMLGTLGWRYEQLYEGRIFEGVSVNGVALGGLAPEEAIALVHARLPIADDEQVVVQVGNRNWAFTASELGVKLDTESTVQAAIFFGREGEIWEQWLERFELWYGKTTTGQLEPMYTRDASVVDVIVTQIANEVALEPRDAILTVKGLSISAIPEEPGRQLDVEVSRERLLQALATNERQVELVTTERQPYVVGAEAAAVKAEALLSEPMVLYFEQPDYRPVGESHELITTRRQWLVEPAQIAEMLLVYSEPLQDSNQHTYNVRLKPELLYEEVASLAYGIERYPRDARIKFDPETKTLRSLVVSQDGLRLNVTETMEAINYAVSKGQHEIEMSVITIPPQVATSDMSKMNITGLAVDGFSDYTGSSDEREINLSVAANQYEGVVIPPGGVFSFNDHLGWVVDATGYEEGYIISGNQTEVDVGGGVCQVSTTVFRAAFNAGFEIVERHPHAYRVPYYENGSPLGFDATVFSPWVDLKFKNDTPNYYIMGVENDREANTLKINLYGPPTGRKVELTSTTTQEVPHLPPVYEEDPALPVGTVEQVDWAHPGATILLQRVVRDQSTGEVVRQDDFLSEYDPWQDRFLVGTGQ